MVGACVHETVVCGSREWILGPGSWSIVILFSCHHKANMEWLSRLISNSSLLSASRRCWWRTRPDPLAQEGAVRWRPCSETLGWCELGEWELCKGFVVISWPRIYSSVSGNKGGSPVADKRWNHNLWVQGTTSAECKTVLTAVLTVKSGLILLLD